MYLRAFLRCRRISVQFYVCETTRCASDALLGRANWHQTFYNAYPVETEATVMKFYVSLHVKAKHRRHIAWFHKHKIEPKHVSFWLEMLSSTYRSVKSVKMDIFHVNIIWWALQFSQGGRIGHPACITCHCKSNQNQFTHLWVLEIQSFHIGHVADCRPKSGLGGGVHSNERGTYPRESSRCVYSWRTRSSLWCMLDTQSGLLEVGIARHWRPVTHFTNGLSIVIQIRRKFLIVLIQVIATNICTCHFSCAVATCAKMCKDVITTN